jgi:hypothetical protein
MNLQKLNQLAGQSWDECNDCDENDRNIWIKGFHAGYNRAKTNEISDEQIEEEARTRLPHESTQYADGFLDGANWYKEQLDISA